MKTRFSAARHLGQQGFSLVEALITIAIMGILSGLVVSAVTNASRDASRMVARQQQSAIQAAVDSWVTSAANTRDPVTGQLVPMQAAITSWTAATTTSARFNLIKTYLDDSVADHILTFTATYGSTDHLVSEALYNSGQYLTLDDWTSAAAGNYPKVSLH